MRARGLVVASLAGIALALALSAMPRVADAGGEGWVQDFEAAKKKAAAEGKDLLIDFTGSDWCGWCIKLREEVFDQAKFAEEAPKYFVLVELDYPQTKEQSPEIKKQNEDLQARFGIEGFPTIFLADAEGRTYAKTGYQEGGAEAYLDHLGKLREKKSARDALFEKAKGTADNVERAKLLDGALIDLGAEGVLIGYEGVEDEIMALDAENAGGLKAKYEGARKLRAADAKLGAIEATLRGGDFEGAIKKIDALMPEFEGLVEAKQKAMLLQAFCHHNLGRKDEAVKLLTAARDLAPDTEVGKRLAEILADLEKGG